MSTARIFNIFPPKAEGKGSLDEAIQQFTDLLTWTEQKKKKNNCKSARIKETWNKNLDLQAWFIGMSVKGSQPSPDELISNFKNVLTSHCQDVINAIWDGNETLYNAIQALDFTQQKLMLKKVLSSSNYGKSDFMLQYVHRIDNIALILEVLDEKQHCLKEKKSGRSCCHYTENQITVLDNRKRELLSPQSDNTGMGEENEENVVQKKRKPSYVAFSSRNKKQRNKEVELNRLIENIIKNMPSLARLDGKTHFFLQDLQVGKDLCQLKNQSKKIWAETGIKVCKKQESKPFYLISISDRDKYSAFLNKDKYMNLTLNTTLTEAAESLFGCDYNPPLSDSNGEDLDLRELLKK